MDLYNVLCAATKVTQKFFAIFLVWALECAIVLTMTSPNLTGKFVNLTPHAINLVGFGVIEPSGKVARCQVVRQQIANVNGVPVFIASYGDVTDLPDPEFGVILIASSLVRGACPDRGDVASPADFERDEKGNVTGCKSLDINPFPY